MSRKRTALTFLLLLVALSGCGHRRRNLLVITIDTLRADHLGCYGFPLAQTSRIDAVAAEGLRCTDAIGAAPITMPAHTSIFTGLFPPAHGVRDNGAYALGEGAVTLAERLRGAGYTTHAFISAIVLNRRYNLNQGFETYDDDLWAQEDPQLFMIRERRAPETADRFLEWFHTWTLKKERPFFTWVHFFDPHQPYHPEPEDLAVARSPYDAEIAGVDRQIGRMLDALKKEGVIDDTLIVITADHGESLGEHSELTHGIFVYDATVHVPLIIRAPWLLKPHTYEAPVRSVDITPTVLEALGVQPLGTMDGRSLLGAFRGKDSPPQLPQYSESLLSEVGFGMAPLYAVRDGGYKYIRAPRPELYDLRHDPHELRNLYASQPRIAARFDAELTRILDASSRHAVKAAANPMSRETEESLQALGYLAPTGERGSMNGVDPKDGLPIHNKLEEARHFAQAQKWDQARKSLLELLALSPRNVSALNVLGLVGVKSGDRQMAIRYYNQSLEIDPDQFRVYAVLGSLALATGDFAGSERFYRRALAINPHFAEVMANLGFLESLRGNQARAEEWYRKGIASDPTFPRVYRRLGDLEYERADYARAYASYIKAIRILPTDMRATLQAGNCARRLNRPAEAASLFRKAQTIRPASWIPEYNRACLLASTGHADDAMRTLQALALRHPLPLDLVARDPDLKSVRALPGYPALRASLRDESVDDEVDADADDG